MEVRLTFEKEKSSWKEVVKKAIFPSQNGKCRMYKPFGGLFKEIPKLISLNNISLTSILQNSTEEFEFLRPEMLRPALHAAGTANPSAPAKAEALATVADGVTEPYGLPSGETIRAVS